MAPTPSAILSTHSGHHRIFIGPVVQKQQPQTTTNGTTSNVSSSYQERRAKSSGKSQVNHHHSRNHHCQAPRPWWDQGSSYLRSHLSLHNLTHSNDQPATTSKAVNGATTAATSLKQTSIPQLSYTFSDDSNSEESYDTDDEEIDEYDSEEERQDYGQDRKVVDDADDYHGHDHDGDSSSSESLSAPVGDCFDESSSSGRQQPTTEREKWRAIDKGKGKAVEDGNNIELDNFKTTTPGTSPLTGLRTKKKRSKSLRDEGEPSGFRKLFGHREGRHHQGQLDSPDLGWESDEHRGSR